MSDNVDPLSVLGDSVIFAVSNLPLQVIPQLIKRGDDGLKSEPTVMAEKPFNVLKDEISRPLRSQYSRKVKEERPSGIFKSLTLSSDAESLARESSDEEVEVGKRVCVDFGDVSIVLMFWEMRFVNAVRMPINLRVSNTYWNWVALQLVGRVMAVAHSLTSLLEFCATMAKCFLICFYDPELETSDARECAEISKFIRVFWHSRNVVKAERS